MSVPEQYEQYVRTVARACRERLGDPAGWVAPDEYRRSLALCIIESVQAAGTELADAGGVVDRYLAYRQARGGGGPVRDGARALLRTFEAAGSADQWAGKIGNYKRRYSASAARLRAVEIQRTAEQLHALRIDSVADLVGATRDRAARDDLRAVWDRSSGAKDDTTWQHLLLLAGASGAGDGTGATEAFVRSALTEAGLDPAAAPPASDVLRAAADHLGVPSPALEHAVRRWNCTLEDHFAPSR